MKRLGLVAVLLAAAVALVATASAATTTTYHGTFSGPVVYDCTTTPPPAVASGTWNVALHGAAVASVAVDIKVDGKHHVSFGYGKFEQVQTLDGEAFAVEIPTDAGPLRVSLAGDAFVYQIAPYNLFGLDCRSVTYNGTLTG